jgi:hypothetical protein
VFRLVEVLPNWLPPQHPPPVIHVVCFMFHVSGPITINFHSIVSYWSGIGVSASNRDQWTGPTALQLKKHRNWEYRCSEWRWSKPSEYLAKQPPIETNESPKHLWVWIQMVVLHYSVYVFIIKRNCSQYRRRNLRGPSNAGNWCQLVRNAGCLDCCTFRRSCGICKVDHRLERLAMNSPVCWMHLHRPASWQ